MLEKKAKVAQNIELIHFRLGEKKQKTFEVHLC